MIARRRIVVLVTVGWAVALLGAGGPPALARPAPHAPRPTAAAVTPVADPRAPRAPEPASAPADFALARAAMEQSRGNLRGVVASLDTMDFSHGPAFAGADRAAFLLAQAWRRLGERERFASLAQDVARWPIATPWTRELEFERRAAMLTPGSGSEADSTPFARGERAADLLAAEQLLRDGHAAEALRIADALASDPACAALALHVRARAHALAGADETPDLAALAVADTLSPLGRDLAGAALLTLAVRASARGDDARALLARVPAGCRDAARAEHLFGTIAMEQGDTAAARVHLAAALAAGPQYAGRRQVAQALAGLDLERGEWKAAYERYAGMDRERRALRDSLDRTIAARDYGALWAAWDADPGARGTLALDGRPFDGRAGALVRAVLEAGEAPASGAGVLAAAPRANGLAVDVLPPDSARWDGVQAARARLEAARGSLERASWDAAEEREALADLRRYLAGGLRSARAEREGLRPVRALLDSLRGAIDATDARLRALRDLETRRLIDRTTAMLEASRANARWERGMLQLYVNGPDSLRQQAGPGGIPGPNSVVWAEQQLTAALAAFAEKLGAQAPALLARSYEQAWGPSLVDRAVTQAAEAGHDLAWAGALASSIDSSLAAAAGSDHLRALEAQVARLTRRADSLNRDLVARREATARDAVTRTIAALEREREGTEYGLAVAAYALAAPTVVHDSAAAPVAARTGATGATTPVADTAEDPEAARWRATAVPLLRGFLDAHPRSEARGEMRFRLADLELVEARQQFRERMAGYLESRSGAAAGGGALPVLDPSRALALYRAILAEDSTFAHRDAVLFDAGMILADAGDPGSRHYFEQLVREYPGSAYGQESWLRMGDMAFDERDFPASVECYARAAQGADPTLAAMADYKMGWAHFNQDRFEPAADAFRAVLDLYAARRGQIQVDIEGEAESYLVHSLAGAGGADAFERAFARSGARPYERRVLMELGQHYRRYGELAEATGIDALVLKRFPDGPEALVAAQRLVETQHRADRADQERATKLELAPRFAPGGSWYRAQETDSARAAGEAFAREAWLSVARDAHRRAREKGGADDWREARRLYETVLEHWPKDPGAAKLELGAGEASAQLGEYAEALRHDRAAAKRGDDTLAVAALWQAMAATDAWYEHDRAGRARGSDTLAHAVLEAGDELLSRFPSHPRGADVAWRQGQLALAHGWDERAVGDLGRVAERWPDDKRAPVAAGQRGDALFRMGRFEDAGTAFEAALASARRAGRDSLARRAERAIPVCAYRRAEAAVAADSGAYARHAELFEQVAIRFPTYENAHVAQYRAGLAWARAGKPRESVRALQALVDRFPKSEYVRDARLKIAQVWDAAGEREQAAQAYLDFAQHHPKDEGAAAAWLQAADLLTAAGQGARADELRLAYVRQHPGDVETAMQVLATLAERELDAVSPGHPLSALLPATPARGKVAPPPASRLAEYLALARKHPAMVSRPLLAHVRFLQADAAEPAFAALHLTQPLTKSIPGGKRMLDTLLARYRRCADVGVPVWAHASAFRIGRALVGFANALDHADAPPDLAGADLEAYRSVLGEQSRAFSTRGEDVWSQLLRSRAKDAAPDAWMAQAQQALWPRLANRFLFMPEVDFPLVDAEGPPRDRDSGASTPASDDSTHEGAPAVRPPSAQDRR